MPKIFTEHELCEKRIEELKKTLRVIEDNIIDYTPLHILNADPKGLAPLNVLWQLLLCH